MKNDFQPIKSDMKQERDKLCYLTIGDKDEKWGVVVTTIGYQFIPPGTKYPLSAHPDNSGGDVKIAALEAGATPNPFLDPSACRAYAERSRGLLAKRLADEKAGTG